MTAIGIGWGIGWLPYSADYSRFVPRSTSRRRLFLAASLGQFVPVMWLGVLGASIATTGTGADPAVIIVQTFGVLSIPVLLLVIHGPIATNILNVYSMSVAALALDVKVPRHILSVGSASWPRRSRSSSSSPAISPRTSTRGWPAWSPGSVRGRRSCSCTTT